MEEETPRYTCKECGMAVIVHEGHIIRACPHDDAAVLAACSATATGESSTGVK